MKKVVFICAYLLMLASGHAQNTVHLDSLNSSINAIKCDTSFIYAESTMKDALEAQTGAKALLELKVYDWLRSKHKDEDIALLVSNSKDKWFTLLGQRGNYTRIFAYVNKKDVLPVAEVPTPVEVEDEEPVPVFEDVLIPKLTADEENMVAINSFEEIEPYMMGLKNGGRLHAYGKYASLPEDDPCYMFVYDREGSVVAVLCQLEGGKHYNLRTQKEDHVRNYKNCGAIWLQFK